MRLKVFLFSFLLLFACALEKSWAWAGGPWSGDNNLSEGADGTYQGIITGSDITGVLMFSWAASPSTETSGNDVGHSVGNHGLWFVWSLNTHVDASGTTGLTATYRGDLQAVVDFSSKKVAGVLEEKLEYLTLTGSNAAMGVYEYIYFLPGNGGGGFFQADIVDEYPQIRFSGTGSFFAPISASPSDPYSSVTFNDFFVTGVRSSLNVTPFSTSLNIGSTF